MPAGTPLRELPAVQGTGPYKVASFDPKTGIRLTRNPSFREWSRAAQPDGYPDVIDVRYGGTADGRIATVLRGGADLASGVAAPSPAMLQSLRTRHLSQLRVNPWYGTWFVVLNTKVAPFDNVLARRALDYALDRAHLRDLALGQGNGKVTCQVLPPDIDGFRPYCPYTVAPNAAGTWTGPDLARARELVRRSGTEGQRVTFYPAEVDPVQQRLGPIPRVGPRQHRLPGEAPGGGGSLRAGRCAEPHPGRVLRVGPALRRARRLHPVRTLLRRHVGAGAHLPVLRPGDRPRDGARRGAPDDRPACRRRTSGRRSITSSPTRRRGRRSRTGVPRRQPTSCARGSRTDRSTLPIRRSSSSCPRSRGRSTTTARRCSSLPTRGARPRELLSQFEVLFPDADLVRIALRGMAAYQLSWWDAHMWAYAERFGLSELLSEDFQTGRLYGTVQVVNPFVP